MSKKNNNNTEVTFRNLNALKKRVERLEENSKIHSKNEATFHKDLKFVARMILKLEKLVSK